MSTHTHPSLVTAAVRTSDPHVVRGRPTRFDRWVAAGVQDTIAASRVRLELWDHSSPYDSTEPPIGDLLVHDRQTLVGLAVNPDLWFGERYMSGQLDVRGRLSAIVEALTRTTTPPASWWARARRALSSPNTLRTSRDNVHHHYDLGNEFYQHWLDRDLVYTCAYFDHPDTPLDQAQQAKLDLGLPQAPATAGRHRRRSRLRVGRAGAPHGSQLRCADQGIQPVTGAARVRARTRDARGTDRSRRVHRRRLSQRAGTVRRLRVGRHARARRCGKSSRGRRRHQAQPAP